MLRSEVLIRYVRGRERRLNILGSSREQKKIIKKRKKKEEKIHGKMLQNSKKLRRKREIKVLWKVLSTDDILIILNYIFEMRDE